jgi:hypothetical protein
VNCLTGEPFKESGLPTLLMQDLSIVGMFAGPNVKTYAAPADQRRPLFDWAPSHRVVVCEVLPFRRRSEVTACVQPGH